jgi:class 3 adenylate cyclase
VVTQSLSFLRPVPLDGRDLLARASVIHQSRFLVSTVEITDVDGNQVVLGSQTCQGVPRQRGPTTAPRERVLATVLFTDIVGSTAKAEELGDARWRELLEQHHKAVRAQLQTFRGREVKTTGDGFLATFDAPTRAVQCARAIRDGLRPLGLEIRAGLHTGECEEMPGGDVAGVAVHVASRVQSAAGAGEILVSGTVRDLVSGSGLRLVERGVHDLKGLEGKWALFAVEG